MQIPSAWKSRRDTKTMSPWLHHTFFLILPHWRKSCCWLVVFSKNYSMPLFLPRNLAFTINPFDWSRRNLWLKLHKLKPVTKRKLPPLKDISYHLPSGRSLGVTRLAAICSVIPSHDQNMKLQNKDISAIPLDMATWYHQKKNISQSEPQCHYVHAGR